MIILENNINVNIRKIMMYSIIHQGLLIFIGFFGYFINYWRYWILYSSYLFTGLGMYISHWLGHTKIIHCWYDFHVMGHHIKKYPPSKFMKTNYESL